MTTYDHMTTMVISWCSDRRNNQEMRLATETAAALHAATISSRTVSVAAFSKPKVVVPGSALATTLLLRWKRRCERELLRPAVTKRSRSLPPRTGSALGSLTREVNEPA